MSKVGVEREEEVTPVRPQFTRQEWDAPGSTILCGLFDLSSLVWEIRRVCFRDRR